MPYDLKSGVVQETSRTGCRGDLAHCLISGTFNQQKVDDVKETDSAQPQMCTLATDVKTLEGAQQTVGWVTPVVMIFFPSRLWARESHLLDGEQNIPSPSPRRGNASYRGQQAVSRSGREREDMRKGGRNG